MTYRFFSLFCYISSFFFLSHVIVFSFLREKWISSFFFHHFTFFPISSSSLIFFIFCFFSLSLASSLPTLRHFEFFWSTCPTFLIFFSSAHFLSSFFFADFSLLSSSFLTFLFIITHFLLPISSIAFFLLLFFPLFSVSISFFSLTASFLSFFFLSFIYTINSKLFHSINVPAFSICQQVCWAGWVWFYGISTFVSYLIPNRFYT